MALLEGQAQVRDLVMGRGTRYKLLDFNPWSRQVRADQAGDRAWNHGGWSGAEWTGEAAVPMSILVRGVTADAAGWVAAHQQLAEAFRSIGEDVGDVELRWMIGGREYVMFGRPRMVDPEVKYLNTGQVYTKAAFVALDPFIYAADESVAGPFGLPTFTGGLTIPGSPILNSNPGFETDTSGWFSFGGTLERSTAQAYQGVASGLLTPDGVTATVEAGVPTSASPTVNAGETYRHTAWVYSPNGYGSVTLAIRWLDAADATIVTESAPEVAVPAGVWTLLSWQREAPANAAKASPRVWITGTPAVSDTLHIDEMRLKSTAGGLPVPFTVDGVMASGFTDLTNDGTREAGLLFRIDGPVQEPWVVLQRDDVTQVLRFDLNLAAGQWLDIDTANRTALLNGKSSRRGSASGDWPLLPKGGPHRLVFRAADFDASAQLTVRHRSVWW